MESPAIIIREREPLGAAELAELRAIISPTIANAIEGFGVRPRLEGYTDASVRCMFPERGTMVGYAATAMVMTNQPSAGKRHVNRRDYWELTMRQAARGPVVTVVQDVGQASGGAYWGEVNSTLHKKLGSIGVLTNGTVRDLDEVRLVGFHMFASGVHVSHGYGHLEDFNRPVMVFGMMVNPGDLIHADQHGAVVIPHDIAREVAAAARRVEDAERPILEVCRAASLDLDALDRLISPEY